MKLCHVVPSLQEQHGGPSRSVLALCQALARAGHEVELLSTDPAAPAKGETRHESARLRVRVFRRAWPQRLCRSPGLRDALAASSAEVIHHHALWLRTLGYAHTQAARQGRPLVISPRGMMSPWAWRHHAGRKQLFRHLLHPSAFETAAGWHATSEEEQADIQALGFTQPSCVAPNGVQEPAPEELAAARLHWLRVCPEAARRRTALFYGRFHQKKRVVELIEAWLQHAPQDWLLLLVGLPEQFSPEELERYARQQSGGGRVRAYSGAGQPAPYAVASLFLLPSHSENFGLTIAEAMAHGVPALVTDSTPWQALNIDDRGWCVPWENYAMALRAATAEEPQALRQRGATARAWVLREYAWDRAAATLARFYATLVLPR